MVVIKLKKFFQQASLWNEYQLSPLLLPILFNNANSQHNTDWKNALLLKIVTVHANKTTSPSLENEHMEHCSDSEIITCLTWLCSSSYYCCCNRKQVDQTVGRSLESTLMLLHWIIYTSKTINTSLQIFSCWETASHMWLFKRQE